MRDVGLHGVACACRCAVAPQLIDELAETDGLVGSQGKDGQHAALSAPAERHRTARDEYLKRPEDADLHALPLTALGLVIGRQPNPAEGVSFKAG